MNNCFVPYWMIPFLLIVLWIFPADNIRNPLNIAWLWQNQFEDHDLNAQHQQHPDTFPIKYVNQCPLSCYWLSPHDPENAWRICTPTALLNDTIHWFHLILGHVGTIHIFDSIQRMFHHPALHRTVYAYTCHVCQHNKQHGPGYGELPPHDAPLAPWEEVHVDLIGPWSITIVYVVVQGVQQFLEHYLYVFVTNFSYECFCPFLMSYSDLESWDHALSAYHSTFLKKRKTKKRAWKDCSLLKAFYIDPLSKTRIVVK